MEATASGLSRSFRLLNKARSKTWSNAESQVFLRCSKRSQEHVFSTKNFKKWRVPSLMQRWKSRPWARFYERLNPNWKVCNRIRRHTRRLRSLSWERRRSRRCCTFLKSRPRMLISNSCEVKSSHWWLSERSYWKNTTSNWLPILTSLQENNKFSPSLHSFSRNSKNLPHLNKSFNAAK